MAEDFDPRFDPAFQPGYDPSKDTARAARSPQESVALPEPSAAASRAGAETMVSGPDEEEFLVEPNPFERILWIVAAALVIGGIAVTFWSNSVSYYTEGAEYTWQQVLQQSAWSLSTPMITIGLATAVALLFRRAAQWRPGE